MHLLEQIRPWHETLGLIRSLWNPNKGVDRNQWGNSDQERNQTLRRLTCFNCGKFGHEASNSYAREGENPLKFGQLPYANPIPRPKIGQPLEVKTIVGRLATMEEVWVLISTTILLIKKETKLRQLE
jgi:hypothetical protein